jgi:voltage-gated potassium channel
MPSNRHRVNVGVAALEWLLARKPNNLLVLVGVLVFVGTIGYMLVESMRPLDALYQTIITLSTVGYADLMQTDAGRVFNIAFMTVGVGVFIMTFSWLAAYLVEGRLREAIGRRRMERDIGALRDHIIVCGFGRFGQLVVTELEKHDLDYAIVEADEDRVRTAEASGQLVLHADATEDSVLIRAGIEHAKGIISTLGSDAANVYVALTAKQIRPELTVVTMARDPSAESKLRAAGADYVVSPYTIGAVTLARRITRPHLSTFLDSTRGLKVRLEEIAVRAGSHIAHHMLKDTSIRQEHGVTVVAVVKTRDEDIHYNPEPDLMIEAGDVLVAVGSLEGLASLAEECATPRQE